MGPNPCPESSGVKRPLKTILGERIGPSLELHRVRSDLRAMEGNSFRVFLSQSKDFSVPDRPSSGLFPLSNVALLSRNDRLAEYLQS